MATIPSLTIFLPIFLTMNMTFKINDNTTKDNVTVTSPNISQNNGKIRFFEDFEKLTYFSNHEDDIQS